MRTAVLRPWLLLPEFFVVASALGLNFVDDGLRDAAE